MRQSEKSGSGNSGVRKSGGSNNMSKKDEEGKRSSGSLNSYQKNSQQLNQPRVDKNNLSSSGDSRFISASFGADTNNQTLKNTKETKKIVEVVDPRSQRSMPQHNSRPSAQTQVTAKANMSSNIQNAQSNFSFASGSIPPHSKQNSNLIQTRTDGSNSYMSPHQMQFGSVSPTPEVFSSEIGLSGGQVGLSQRSNEFGARQLTSTFPLKNTNVTNFDANSYMPVQMSADTGQSLANSKEKSRAGQVRTASEIQKSQDHLIQINKQNDAIMQRIKEQRNNCKNEPDQRIPRNIEQFSSSGNQNFSQLKSYAADGASMAGVFTGTKGSYISSTNQAEAATDYPSDRLNIFNQQQYMNRSADKLAFGLPMPMSPQEGEFIQKRFMGVQEEGLDSQREGSYELDGQQYQQILNGFRMDQLDDQNSLHQKIDQLRKYRMLCEQRIMQLYPGHPIPVQDHHLLLGKSYDSTEDIDGSNLPLKQHLDLVCHEKAQLEKALRDETLANEEQRNYIQILKNVIEQKLERDGLMELLKQGGRSDYNTFGNSQKSNMNDDPINIFISLSDMKHQLDQTRLENNKQVEQLKNQNQVLHKMEQDFNSKISNANKQLKFYHEQCQILQNQLQPSNERCEQLEDYVSKQIEEIEQLNKELQLCKNAGIDPDGTNNTMFQQLLSRQSPNYEKQNPNQIASIQSLISQQDQQISQHHSMTTDVKQSLCNEIEGLNKELRSVQRACQLSKEQFQQVELESQKQHQHIQSLQEKLTFKDTELRQLKQSLEMAQTDLFQKEQQLDSLSFSNLQLEKRIELVANKDKFKDFEHIKQIEEAQINYIDEQRKVEQLSNNLEKTSKQLTKELQTIKQALHESENELNQKTQEVERLDSELDLKIAQLESYQRSGKQDKHLIRDLTTKLEDRKIQLDDLKIEKIKRDEKMQLDSNSRDQLMKEKAQINLQVNELSHQLEIIKMQNQTTIVKSEQQVKESTSRADALERIQKSRLNETEILTNELTKTSCHLKQAQSQLLYYEKANEQLSADLRKSKSDIDSFEREKVKQATEISNLVEENEQLYRNEERARRINEELQSQKNQGKNLEKEITDIDKKLRASFEVKEAQDLEINKLKREIQTLESDKITLIKQKETLSIQTRDSERRVFDYVKMNQDNDQKIRQNAIFIKDLVQERDKYKQLQETKEKEIGDIGLENKALRQKLTDLTLIEEKVSMFLQETEATINQNKKQLHDFLRQFLRTVNNSDSLCQKVNMRKRDQGFQIQDKLSHQVTQQQIQVWQRMAAFKSTQMLFAETNEYLIEMLDLLMQNYIELNADAAKKERQVGHLETKLGSIHSIDYQAQQQAINLKDELSDLRRKFAETDFEKEREIQCLNETLKLVQNHNLDLQHVATLTKKQLSKTINDKPGQAKQKDKEMHQTLQLLQMEKVKLLDLLHKVQNYFRGQPTEQIVEKMTQCALAIAKSLTDKETLSTDISKYEVQLQKAMIDAHRQQQSCESSPIKPGNFSSMKYNVGSPMATDSKSAKVQSLKSELTQKEGQMQEIEDRIAFEQGKYNMLEHQLHEIRQEGDVDLYPNRENPFQSAKTHSFELMLKETKELRQKLNERNTMINSLENELKKIKTMQTMKFANDTPQSHRYDDYENRDSELKL